MNQILKILPFFLLITFGCKAQKAEPSDFVPKGYTEFKKYFGDLNKDVQNDCVLIIKKTDTTNIVTNRFDEKVDRNRRGIIVLFRNGSDYQLADKNYGCFSSENEDGGVYFPPEQWIDIHRFRKGFYYYSHRENIFRQRVFEDGYIKLQYMDGLYFVKIVEAEIKNDIILLQTVAYNYNGTFRRGNLEIGEVEENSNL